MATFLREARPAGIDADAISARVQRMLAHKPLAAASLGDLPVRPPTFCTGCPERPVFSAIKLMQRELGPTHISGDIGCHAFATFAPFSMGNSILGYGMSLASAAAVTPNFDRRPIAMMGDGGFWHNGLITGVTSNLFNKGDGVLIIMQNGYASATGQQYLPSSSASRLGAAPGMDIETTLRSLGVTWMRKVRTYGVAKMTATLKEAMRTAERGLKVIIADGECQLARQRRVRAEDAEKLKRGERVTKTRYGVDDAICTGDHSCIRLSGCPSLTVKPNPDPLRTDPVAAVIESCVGCGLCGEVAHAAVLCPSFYRAEVVRNPGVWDRMLHAVRTRVISMFGGARATGPLPRLRGEGRGGGSHRDRSKLALSPPLSRKGEREQTESGRGAVAQTKPRSSHHPAHRGARRRRRRRAHQLDRQRGGAAELPGAVDVDPGRRAAHRRHHLLHRDPAGGGARRRRQAGAGARARRRRRRRDDGERADGSRPRRRAGLRHRRPHALDRIDLTLLGDGREDRDGRRPLRLRKSSPRRSRRIRAITF